MANPSANQVELGQLHLLVLELGWVIMIVVQVAILMSRFAGSMHAAASQGPASVVPWANGDLSKMGDLHEGVASVQRRLDSVVQALAANGINI